ncbi:MAG: DNA polymerase III subunit epsilon [Buchnera aphidicola (Periphyllus lyropictus)]|uniref:DNA polymerase III subunit epsilon n=1 Tax=Buchnera aphidicola TaxID=9 RepID=UPI001ED6771E|nr:DNA polymerase III subunit epsilon [Buchnera aphidicola]NIH16626.1 DNA polymerase III subunit epsilon [Buchnera aphidicola (Periphyllus lyropictus)]USS94538.1 DNA polymerase III subunit epsilon [Buchnera aphidicola (Periphyllus lyropictus)]
MNKKFSRKVVLDTETTGINSSGPIYLNHRIIEIGAIEIIDRKITKNIFHTYIKPNRLVEKEAYKIHGISDNFLINKPIFSEIYKKFLNYIKNSQLIIHNAKFDLGFINYELTMLNKKIPDILNFCTILDTLKLSRKIFPGKKNSLEALCKRYKINYNRKLHSAILDAKLLAQVYLLMTSSQKSFFFMNNNSNHNILKRPKENKFKYTPIFKKANVSEINLHKKYLKKMKKNGKCLWLT